MFTKANLSIGNCQNEFGEKSFLWPCEQTSNFSVPMKLLNFLSSSSLKAFSFHGCRKKKTLGGAYCFSREFESFVLWHVPCYPPMAKRILSWGLHQIK